MKLRKLRCHIYLVGHSKGDWPWFPCKQVFAGSKPPHQFSEVLKVFWLYHPMKSNASCGSPRKRKSYMENTTVCIIYTTGGWHGEHHCSHLSTQQTANRSSIEAGELLETPAVPWRSLAGLWGKHGSDTCRALKTTVMAEGNDCLLDMFKSCIKQHRSMDEKRFYKVCWLSSTQISKEISRGTTPPWKTTCVHNVCSVMMSRGVLHLHRWDWRAQTDTSHTSPGPTMWTRLALNL